VCISKLTIITPGYGFRRFFIGFHRLDFQTNKFAPKQSSNGENTVSFDVTRLFVGISHQTGFECVGQIILAQNYLRSLYNRTIAPIGI